MHKVSARQLNLSMRSRHKSFVDIFSRNLTWSQYSMESSPFLPLRGRIPYGVADRSWSAICEWLGETGGCSNV